MINASFIKTILYFSLCDSNHTVFLLFSIFVFGQKSEKFSLFLQLQPELTFHKNDYAFRRKQKKILSTFNIGLNALLQYKLTQRISVDFGLGFI